MAREKLNGKVEKSHIGKLLESLLVCHLKIPLPFKKIPWTEL